MFSNENISEEAKDLTTFQRDTITGFASEYQNRTLAIQRLILQCDGGPSSNKVQIKINKIEDEEAAFSEKHDQLIKEYRVKLKSVLEYSDDPELIHNKYIEYLERKLYIPSDTCAVILKMLLKTEYDRIIAASVPDNFQDSKVKSSFPNVQLKERLEELMKTYCDKLTDFMETSPVSEKQIVLFSNEVERAILLEIQIKYPSAIYGHLTEIKYFQEKVRIELSKFKDQVLKNSEAQRNINKSFEEFTQKIYEERALNCAKFCVEEYVTWNQSKDHRMDSIKTELKQYEKPNKLANRLLRKYKSKMRTGIIELELGSRLSSTRLQLLHILTRLEIVLEFHERKNCNYIAGSTAEIKLQELIEQAFTDMTRSYYLEAPQNKDEISYLPCSDQRLLRMTEDYKLHLKEEVDRRKGVMFFSELDQIHEKLLESTLTKFKPASSTIEKRLFRSDVKLNLAVSISQYYLQVRARVAAAVKSNNPFQRRQIAPILPASSSSCSSKNEITWKVI